MLKNQMEQRHVLNDTVIVGSGKQYGSVPMETLAISDTIRISVPNLRL